MSLTYSYLRSVAIECLAKPYSDRHDAPPYTTDILFGLMARELQARGAQTAEGTDAWLVNKHHQVLLHPYLQLWAQDIVWDLIVEGILRPGYNEHASLYPAIHLTEFGRQSLVQLTPYDPDKYIQHLLQLIPSLDSVILAYVTESVETFRRNCLLSSTITLGCASEKAFLLVSDAYRDALEPTLAAQFRREMDRLRSIKLQHAEFEKWYTSRLRAQLKSSKSTDWVSYFEDALHLVFSYLRDMRNDAGHPTGVKFTRERVQSHLVIFPSYLRQFYDAIEWMNANKPLP